MFGRKLNTQDQDIWISSDLHMDHSNILKFCPDTRPFKTVQHMNSHIISEWNSRVKPNDIIFHLGDFCFKGVDVTESFLSQLNGKKVFVLGNHDRALRNGIPRGKFGIIEICDYLEVRIDGVKVCMSHYPMTTWNNCSRGSQQWYGHCHNSLPEPKGRQTDVGYDHFGKIMNVKDVIKFCEKKPIFTPDHH